MSREAASSVIHVCRSVNGEMQIGIEAHDADDEVIVIMHFDADDAESFFKAGLDCVEKARVMAGSGTIKSH